MTSKKKLSSLGHYLVATIEHIIEATLDPEIILGRSLCSTRVFTLQLKHINAQVRRGKEATTKYKHNMVWSQAQLVHHKLK